MRKQPRLDPRRHLLWYKRLSFKPEIEWSFRYQPKTTKSHNLPKSSFKQFFRWGQISRPWKARCPKRHSNPNLWQNVFEPGHFIFIRKWFDHSFWAHRIYCTPKDPNSINVSIFKPGFHHGANKLVTRLQFGSIRQQHFGGTTALHDQHLTATERRTRALCGKRRHFAQYTNI